MLVIVKDRNIEHSFERLFDVETFRSLDVFQVDAAKSGGDAARHVDDFIRVVAVHFDVKHIYVSKFLEKHALSFHDWLAGQCAAVAQAEDGCTVGKDSHKVAF